MKVAFMNTLPLTSTCIFFFFFTGSGVAAGVVFPTRSSRIVIA
jgi:hypothetical protein